MRAFAILIVLTVFCLQSHAAAGAADKDARQAGREVLKKNQDALVGLSALVKADYSGEGFGHDDSDEEKTETVATVIDPSGLAVASLTALGGGGYAMLMAGNDGPKIKYTFSDVKMRLADGTEVPANVILKDADLDLVFIMPAPAKDKPARAFASVKLEKIAKPEVLDSLFVIDRMGEELDYQPMIVPVTVSALVAKPRFFICYEGPATQNPGTPAFNLDGKAVGLTICRKANIVILPPEDVMESARQAMDKAKAPVRDEKAKDGAREEKVEKK